MEEIAHFQQSYLSKQQEIMAIEIVEKIQLFYGLRRFCKWNLIATYYLTNLYYIPL